MMRPNPMDRNTGGLGYNKNIAQVHSKLNKMPDSYLTQLIQQESPFAVVAAMVLDTRQGMAQKAIEPPTSTVANNIVSQVGGGIPNVPLQQPNQDPRLMAGVGGMNTNPVAERNSMDTPMNGIAQLPAERMMADGGIVGFQDRGLVEEPFDPRSLQVEMDPRTGMPLETDNLNEGAGSNEEGWFSRAAPYIGTGLLAIDPALRLAEKVPGGWGKVAKTTRALGTRYRNRALKGKTYKSPGKPPPAPSAPTRVKVPDKINHKTGKPIKETPAQRQARQAKADAEFKRKNTEYKQANKKYKADKKAYDAKVKTTKEANVKIKEARGGLTNKEIIRRKALRDASIAGGLGTLGIPPIVKYASGDDEAPAPATMQQQQRVKTPLVDKEAETAPVTDDADKNAETAKYNMFDKIVGGITSGDMTRFGLNMAERAGKGGSGLTAIVGGAYDTRKQLDERTAANLDREAKKLYYEALSTNAVNAAGAKALEGIINRPGFLQAEVDRLMAGNPKLTQTEASLQVVNEIRRGLGLASISALGEDNPIDPRFEFLGPSKGVTPSA